MAREPQFTIETYFPLQALQISNLILHPPSTQQTSLSPQYGTRIPMFNLSYKDSLLGLPRLGLFTPFLTIHAWDSKSGRLDLKLEDNETNTLLKLQALQDYLIQSLQTSEVSKDEQIKFQHFLTDDIFTVFINQTDTALTKLFIYTSSTKKWTSTINNDIFVKGTKIRIALRCYGLLCIPIQTGGTRYRMQHCVSAVYITDT